MTGAALALAVTRPCPKPRRALHGKVLVLLGEGGNTVGYPQRYSLHCNFNNTAAILNKHKSESTVWL